MKRDEVDKLRVREEIHRVKQRQVVSEEERARLLHEVIVNRLWLQLFLYTSLSNFCQLCLQAMTMDAPRLARKMVEDRKEMEIESSSGAFLSCYYDETSTQDPSHYSSDESFFKAISEVDHLRRRLLDRAAVGTRTHRDDEQKAQDVSDILNDLIDCDVPGGNGDVESINVSRGAVSKAHLERARSDLEIIDLPRRWYSESNECENFALSEKSLELPKNGGLTPLLKSGTEYFGGDRFPTTAAITASDISARDSSHSLLQTSLTELNKLKRSEKSINHVSSSLQSEGKYIGDRPKQCHGIEDVLIDALGAPTDTLSNYVAKGSGHSMRSIDGDLAGCLRNLLGELEDQISVHSSKNDHNGLHSSLLEKDTRRSETESLRSSALLSPTIGAKYNIKNDDAGNSHLLALATAVEAGDAAGRLVAEFMAARSANTGTGIHVRDSRERSNNLYSDYGEAGVHRATNTRRK